MLNDMDERKLHLEQEKLAHSRWWQEDSLVNNRMTWLLTSQTILFAAYGVAISNGSSRLQPLIHLLPWMALGIVIVIALGVHSAWNAQKVLQKEYEAKGIEVGVHRATTWGGRTPGWGLPIILVAGWAALVCSEHDLGTAGIIFGAVASAIVLVGVFLAFDDVVDTSSVKKTLIPRRARGLPRTRVFGPPPIYNWTDRSLWRSPKKAWPLPHRLRTITGLGPLVVALGTSSSMDRAADYWAQVKMQITTGSDPA